MVGKEIRAEVGRHNGGMSLFIDGKAQPFTFFKITETPSTKDFLDAAEVEIPAMARNGVNLCWVPVFLDWKGPGEYDFTDFDKRLTTVLDLYDAHTPAGAPKAFIGVRVQAAVFTPPWYVRKFADKSGRPTNLLEFRNPWAVVDSCSVDELEKQRFATAFARYGSTLAISPGDEFWDTHAIDCLKAIVEHVRSSPYAHRVFGWLPCAFNTNEWFIRTFAPEATCDFSAPTQRAFKEHLRSKNVGSPEAPVPSPVSCQKTGIGEFLDFNDPEGMRVELFSLWLNNRVADIIMRFTGLIKRMTTDSPKIVGVFYGYTLGLSRLQNLSQCGQLDLARILECKDIDFLCSPAEYYCRPDEKPFTASMVMGPYNDAGECHNKLCFLEDDHPPVFDHKSGAAFTTRDDWQDEMYFRQHFAQTLSHGQQLWWYSLGAKWFKERLRHNIVGKLFQVATKAMEKDRASLAEVAVVIDERSVSAMRFNPTFQRMLLTDSHAAFMRTGAPFECYESSTFLKHVDPSRFKFVAFLNLFRVDADVMAAVEKLKSAGRTLMFSFAPGALLDSVKGRAFSMDSASELVGMRLEREPVDVPLTVWVDPERTSLIPGGEDIRYGWTHLDIGVSPPFLGITDPAAEELGFLHSGTAGLGLRRHDCWTSVFTSAPCAPQEVLRALMRRAGVHIYSESGEVVYANRSMFACSASSRGEKAFRLPRLVTLVDVLTGERIHSADGAHRMFMRRNETRIFWIQD